MPAAVKKPRYDETPYETTVRFLVKQEPFVIDQMSGDQLPSIFRKYGLPVEVHSVFAGPTITTVKLKIHGVTSKLSVLPKVEKDLAFHLNVPSVRITRDNENGLIDIEVPNKKRIPVRLSHLMKGEQRYAEDYVTHLEFPAGVEVDGTPVYYYLADMPHLLIAGTTGSGKSVFVNSIITSLVMQNCKESMRLLLIDPKRGVEFGQYEGLPHLLERNAYTSEEAASSLNNLIWLMDERYKDFKKAKKRDIQGFNAELYERGDLPMPFIVVVIDEAAFLFEDYPEIQEMVINLAQLGRAAGIHIIMATQRPSHDIINGRVKANFPARISFRTASAVDSKVILDSTGAEKLLGMGDALCHIPGHEDTRIQACMVTPEEVELVVDWWKSSR